MVRRLVGFIPASEKAKMEILRDSLRIIIDGVEHPLKEDMRVPAGSTVAFKFIAGYVGEPSASVIPWGIVMHVVEEEGSRIYQPFMDTNLVDVFEFERRKLEGGNVAQLIAKYRVDTITYFTYLSEAGTVKIGSYLVNVNSPYFHMSTAGIPFGSLEEAIITGKMPDVSYEFVVGHFPYYITKEKAKELNEFIEKYLLEVDYPEVPPLVANGVTEGMVIPDLETFIKLVTGDFPLAYIATLTPCSRAVKDFGSKFFSTLTFFWYMLRMIADDIC